MVCEVHHVLLRGCLDILVPHRLDSLLLRAQLVLKDLELDSILGDLLTFLVKGNPQLAHLILNSFLIGLEEADLLGVTLIVLALLPNRLSSPVKGLLLHVEALDLLLQLIIKVLDLRMLLLKFCLALLKLALLHL